MASVVWVSGLNLVAWSSRLIAVGDPLVAALDTPPRRGQSLNLLVVGNDSRDRVDSLTGNFGSMDGIRADALVLVRLLADGVDVISVPRDIRVETPNGGLALAVVLETDGPVALVDAVRDVTGASVHHYIEFGFADVAAIVDAVGGLEVHHANAVRDTTTGLALDAGRTPMTGEDTVAYLRARRLEARVDDRWVPLRSGDLARIDRQLHLADVMLRSIRDRSPADAATALHRARAVGAPASTIRWHDWPRLLDAALTDDVRRCTVPVRTLRSVEQRTSPFAPGHMGASAWLMVDGSSRKDTATDRRDATATGPPSDPTTCPP